MEYFLNLKAVVKSKEPLVNENYEIAYEQFKLSEGSSFQVNKSNASLQVNSTKATIAVKGKDFELSFNKTTGYLTSYIFNGEKLIEKGPQINFWRAPVDNDYGANSQNKFREWKEVGKNEIVKVEVENISQSEVLISCSREIFNGDATCIQTYFVDGNGTVKVTSKLIAEKGEHSNIFKFGNEMVLPQEVKNIEWYGKGPFEAYYDRQHSAKFGVYKSTVSQQYFPYIRPQDTGNKMDVRWVELTKNNGTGLKIIGEQPLYVSALNFSKEDLDSGNIRTQRHAGELTPQKEVFVNVDGFQQGLGSITSWGRLPLEKYRLPYQSYEYSYWIVPIVK